MTRHFLGAALAALLVSHAPHAIADAGTTRAALKAAAREAAAKDKAPPLSRDLLLQRAPVANVQISPDGINWVDEGSAFAPITGETLQFVRVMHFGGWLRLVGEVAGDGARFNVMIHLVLKE